MKRWRDRIHDDPNTAEHRAGIK